MKYSCRYCNVPIEATFYDYWKDSNGSYRCLEGHFPRLHQPKLSWERFYSSLSCQR